MMPFLCPITMETALPRGMVQTMTYGNGQEVFYTYNVLGQVEAVGYTDQPLQISVYI